MGQFKSLFRRSAHCFMPSTFASKLLLLSENCDLESTHAWLLFTIVLETDQLISLSTAKCVDGAGKCGTTRYLYVLMMKEAWLTLTPCLSVCSARLNSHLTPLSTLLPTNALIKWFGN